MASSLLWGLMQPYKGHHPPHQAQYAVMETKQQLPSFHEKAVELLPDAIYQCSHSSKVLLVQIWFHCQVSQCSHSSIEMPAIILT